MGATVAVFDVGSTNLKLSACTGGGAVVETLATPNPHLAGPPWLHHDLGAMWAWLLAGLRDLAGRHPIERVMVTGHGSGAVMVTDDPGQDCALPMAVYEQPLPDEVTQAYAAIAGDVWDRGSAVMLGATHTARQMFWAECTDPSGFARVRHVLAVPQYWAWRLSGVAASEQSILGAQSHLWNVRDRRWAAIVAARGWGPLMPPIRAADEVLGPVRPGLGLPPWPVHVGAHDSSAAFHRYQSGGLTGFAAVSTGTWIVALTDLGLPPVIDEARGMTINADMAGRPVLGALSMGGREFSAVAGDQPPGAQADPAVIAALIARGTLALPMFGHDDGQFPGRAGQGRIVGPPPADAAERRALAVLYVALLTLGCGNMVAPKAPWVLDGSWLSDPAFSGLVAALRPDQPTDLSPEPYGIAAGAALIATGRKADLTLIPARPLPLPGLADYAARWRTLAEGPET
jgi:sugar (pentulose or hexulose) kinase